MQRLCALVRTRSGARLAPRRLTRVAARMRRVLNTIGDPWSQAQARLWYCEWRIVHGLAPDATALAWPADGTQRARLLTVLLNSGHTPAPAAWGWLAGTRVRGATAAQRWPKVWAEFCAAADKATPQTDIRRNTPYCWLAGTPGARAGRVTLVAWRAASIETVFRQAWECSRRTGRETSSRLEDEWYAYVCHAFPGLEPVRHALLARRGMHVDMYWPQRDVALEVQGDPHWHGIPVFGGVMGLAQRQQRDARKRAQCAAAGIRLVEVTADTPVGSALAHLGGLLGVRPRARAPQGG
jgi:hypothetical protein